LFFDNVEKELLMKKKWLRIGGIAAVVAGSAALYVSGSSESEVGGIVAGVFVLAGIIAEIIKDQLVD
jgi:hypothetical protein